MAKQCKWKKYQPCLHICIFMPIAISAAGTYYLFFYASPLSPTYPSISAIARFCIFLFTSHPFKAYQRTRACIPLSPLSPNHCWHIPQQQQVSRKEEGRQGQRSRGEAWGVGFGDRACVDLRRLLSRIPDAIAIDGLHFSPVRTPPFQQSRSICGCCKGGFKRDILPLGGG
jgi:hypothetical protein